VKSRRPTHQLVGNFKNNGREWRPKNTPELVKVHDFIDRTELDENKYPKGVKVSDSQLAAVNLSPHAFHGDWNYTISPDPKPSSRRKRN
jgi:hypothetical protein